MENKSKITVESIINAKIETVWNCWTNPRDIEQWNNASDDWYTPKATNDLRVGGKFVSTMASKDGCMSFDFEGIYTEVIVHKSIKFDLADGRTVAVDFIDNQSSVAIIETFDPENENSIEMQRAGWQAILDNFKKYVEAL